jgi:hypothetical protein
MPNLGEALLHGAATALRTLATQDEQAIQPKLDLLAAAQYDSAQWLLYEALRANGERYAGRAAELLLEGEHRFPCGYLSSPYWTTRQLLQSTTPHMSGKHFALLETAIMDYAPSWENRDQAGWASFVLLRGLFASLCPSCRCVIRWICGVTAGRRVWLCFDDRHERAQAVPE